MEYGDEGKYVYRTMDSEEKFVKDFELYHPTPLTAGIATLPNDAHFSAVTVCVLTVLNCGKFAGDGSEVSRFGTSTLFQPQPIRSPTYPLATYGPFPNVYSPFSTRSGPPSPSPYGYSSHRSPQYSPDGLRTLSRSGSRKSSRSPISRSPSHSELSRNSSYRSNLNNSAFRPVSIMSKKNNSNGNGSGSGIRNGNTNEGSNSRKGGSEIDGGEEQQRVAAEDYGSSGSSGGPSSSMNPSPISPSAADTTAVGQGAISISASMSTNGGKPARKDKAVQWLDHHLNSQAAQAQAQAHAQHRDIDLNDPPASATQGLGLIVDGSLIDNQTSAQVSERLKQLKDLKQRRLKGQQFESEGLKIKEMQLEKITEDNGRRSWSPHALDEKGIDPNPFIELTTALERHQSKSLPRAGNSNFSLTLPRMPPSAYPQSDSATTEKSKATAPAPSVPFLPPPPVPWVHYFPPPRPRAGMTPVHLPPIESHALKDFPQSTAPRGVESSPTDTSLPTPNRPVSGISGLQTPARASTTAESSPDTAMRHAMLPIVPKEDLHPSMIGPGSNIGVKGFWANLQCHSSFPDPTRIPLLPTPTFLHTLLTLHIPF
ncbi:hypothetical protein F5876DRAFT_75944 [Lentinula aff. lateritia]|uniref:Uncharacterized protein n=1 Tax=Lentinula aff. lateritia TaxID=2804960 RepID=A0ACC1U2Q3_9AGAR|nr:hypothetical protein F5876DRAFT_75944 [Lentinula aff. lateritia]